MKRRMTHLAIALLAAVLTIANSGCLQLKEIRDFAKLAGDVGDSFPVLAKDLYSSCMNQQRYIVAQKRDFRFDKFGDLFDDNNPVLADGRAQCKADYKDDEKRLIAANATLVAYLKTLGDLAADDLTNFDKNIDAFGTAATKGHLFNDTQSAAVNGLAKFLLHAATESYRRKKLHDVIREENSDVQKVVAALKDIVSRKYELQLENEQSAMMFYYRKLATQNLTSQKLSAEFLKSELASRPRSVAASLRDKIVDPDAYVNPVPLDQLKTAYEAKNASIRERESGATAYVQILTQVAEGHQYLHDHADKLSSKEVLSTSLSYAKTIEGLVGDFQKAF